MPFDSSSDPFAAGIPTPKADLPDAKTFDDDLADAGKGASSSADVAETATKDFDGDLDDTGADAVSKGDLDGDDLFAAGSGAKGNALGLSDDDDVDAAKGLDDDGGGLLDKIGDLFGAEGDDGGEFAGDKALGSLDGGVDDVDGLDGPDFKGLGDDFDGPAGAHGNADFDDDDLADKDDIPDLF